MDALTQHSIVDAHFDRAIFSAAPGQLISLDDAKSYCPCRIIEVGTQAEAFWAEAKLMAVLESCPALPVVYVLGDAGSGKSTFLRFVLDFYRHYRSEIAEKSWKKVNEFKKVQYSAFEDPFCVLWLQVPDVKENALALKSVYCSVRDQLLKRFPELRTEGEHALLRYSLRLPLKGLLSSRDQEIVDTAYKDSFKDEESEVFCNRALSYLAAAREPQEDRKRIVLVLDDTDFLDNKVAAHVIESLEVMARQIMTLENQAATIVAAVRHDTARIRSLFARDRVGLNRIALGRVYYSDFITNTTKSLRESVDMQLDDVPRVIEVDRNSFVFAPVPRELGKKVSDCVLAAAGSSWQEISSDTPGLASELFLRPLVGNSCRRLKQIYQRIASCPTIYELATLRPSTTFGNYDILQAAIVGPNRTGEGIRDESAIGFWWGDRDEGDGWHCFLGGYVVISIITTGPGAEANVKFVEETASSLGFPNSARIVERLAEYGFIERGSTDGTFAFRKDALEALLRLISEPAYIDVVAALVFDRKPLRLVSHDVNAVAEHLKATFECAENLIHIIATKEADWLDWLIRNANRNDVIDFFKKHQMRYLSQVAKWKYVRRMHGIANDDRYSGFNLSAVKDRSFFRSSVSAGFIQVTDFWREER